MNIEEKYNYIINYISENFNYNKDNKLKYLIESVKFEKYGKNFTINKDLINLIYERLRFCQVLPENQCNISDDLEDSIISTLLRNIVWTR